MSEPAGHDDSQVRHRVLILDDHPIVCSGLAFVINCESDFIVCGQANDFRTARALIERERPDLLLIDLLVNRTLSLDFIKEVRGWNNRMVILVISMMEESVFAPRCVKAGASGFIMKGASAGELLDAMRLVLEGKTYISPGAATELAGHSRGAVDRSNIESVLSDRELQIFHMIGSGIRVANIARQLSISTRTVHAHRQHIRLKLGLRDAAELAAKAASWVKDHAPEGTL